MVAVASDLGYEFVDPAGLRPRATTWSTTRVEPLHPGVRSHQPAERVNPRETVEWALNRRNNVWYARVVYIRNQTNVIDTWFPYMQLTPALP